MRSQFATSLVSAVLGGGVTAAAVIGAGVVDREPTRTVVEQAPLSAAGTARARADGVTALTAREIYKRDAPGVTFVRAQVLETTTSPFDVYDTATRSSESTGSGFVLDEDGHVLTNAHVIDHATAVTVTFSGTRTREAEIVGKDESTDLALLKVDPDGLGLRPLELGNSDDVEVGDPTVAIGNPFGFDRTLTTGVVSAIQRRITAPDDYTIENVIQTDAALNPGNSGGPLIDAGGRVIGINSQIATGGSGSGSVGIGFAVPINTAKEVVAELKEHGRVERPWLGLEFIPVDSSLSALGVRAKAGLLVQEVRSGGPAHRAGVRSGDRVLTLADGDRLVLGGDVVTAIDGRATASADDVRKALEPHEPGDTVAVEVLRDGTEQLLEVTLGNRPPGGSDG